MSRIGNALLKETAVRRLKVVGGTDDVQAQPTEFLPEDAVVYDLKEEKRVWFAAAVVALIVALAVGTWALRKHGVKAPAPEISRKTVSFSAQYQLSAQAFKNRKFEQALRGFTLLLEEFHDKDNAPLLLVNIGMTYKEMGDLPNAKKSYQAAIQADPKDSIAYNNLAMLDADEGDMKSAVGLLEKAISADPEQAAPLLNLGKLYEQEGQWSLAVVYYSKYVESKKGEPSVKERIQVRIRKLHLLSEPETKERMKQ